MRRSPYCLRQESKMQVRKVVTRSGRGFRGYFPSKKLKRMVEWESILERDAIYLFEQSPGVISFQEQPALVHYELDGETKKYFPDFELVLSNDEIIHVEIKPKQKMESPVLTKKIAAIADAYARRGMKFRLLTDADIRQEPRLQNMKLLQQFKTHQISANESKKKVTEILQDGEPVSVSQIFEAIGKVNTLKLLADDFIRCDLEQSFEAARNLASLVKESDHDALHF